MNQRTILRDELIEKLKKLANHHETCIEFIVDGDRNQPGHLHHHYEFRIPLEKQNTDFQKLEVVVPGVFHQSIPNGKYRYGFNMQFRLEKFSCSYNSEILFHLQSYQYYTDLLIRQLEILRLVNTQGEDSIRAKLEKLIIHMTILLLQKSPLEPIPPMRRMESAVKAAGYYIRQNDFRKNLMVSDIVDYVGVDASYLLRVFHKYFNITIRQFIIQTRLRRSCEMLKSGIYTVKEVADRSGWYSSSYFIKIFKQQYGMTPARYAKKMHGSVKNPQTLYNEMTQSDTIVFGDHEGDTVLSDDFQDCQ